MDISVFIHWMYYNIFMMENIKSSEYMTTTLKVNTSCYLYPLSWISSCWDYFHIITWWQTSLNIEMEVMTNYGINPSLSLFSTLVMLSMILQVGVHGIHSTTAFLQTNQWMVPIADGEKKMWCISCFLDVIFYSFSIRQLTTK